MLKSISATFDGACEPFNPGGHMGLGWVINGDSHHRYIAADSANTNNVAEYLALIEILQYAIKHEEITDLSIAGDSQLVCCQLSGEYAVRSASIYAHFQAALEMLNILRKRGCRVSINWHPRECNEAADAASKLALTEHGIKPAVRRAKPTFAAARHYCRQPGVTYVSRTDLRSQGWTDGKIKKLLDPPDYVERFKIRKRKCATYYYDSERVAAVSRRGTAKAEVVCITSTEAANA